MRRSITILLSSFLIGIAVFIAPSATFAYPFWAQQNYENPREATGKIVCANCHLANMKTQAEVPQAVAADSVFKAVVKIPYKNGTEEIGADGSKVPLQVGAVVMLPDGFKLAPQDRWTEEIKEETQGVYFSEYSEEKDNIILVGPLPGDQNKEIVFPVLSPNPKTNKNIHFGKYAIHVGGNRGRGQVYPTGDKSNNNVYNSGNSGEIISIEPSDDGSQVIAINTNGGEVKTENIPAGPTLIVSVGDQIEEGEPLTENPNVGGFGQVDTEIVLQSYARVIGLVVFFAGVALSQIMLVLKKKQVEKVQAAEGI
ncbi:cytochrome f [Prochlorococcus sp. MIT 1223]|uniref:cytochrome f n=1 Tax=Prochlorococcus sp. MIT 1223 TaxID=3096217 RepID=UPI002A7498B5|nr:apocytochrome f [Prochlorococcus sp. MIT 1223]